MCKKGDNEKIQRRDGHLQARQRGLEQPVSSLPLAGTKPANTAIWLLTIHATLLQALGADVQDPSMQFLESFFYSLCSQLAFSLALV